MFSLYRYAYGARFGRGFGGKKKKAVKKRKDSWFEELTVDQLKQLCKACKLTCSGTKQALVERLKEHEFVSPFGGNKKESLKRSTLEYEPGNITTLNQLKAECRQRLLQVGGNKFELVLRICQHEHGTGGDSLKRAATEMATTTNQDGETVQVPVAKKRKPSKPSPATYYNRVQKKIQAVSQKQYQSYWGAKAHAPAVESLMDKLLHDLDEHVESDPGRVLDCTTALVRSFVDNFGSFERPGYCEDLEGTVYSIQSKVRAVRHAVSPEQLDGLAAVLLDWKDVGSPYGLLDEFDMEAVANEIRYGEEKKTSDTPESTKTASTKASQGDNEE